MAVSVRGEILYINFRCYLPDGRRVRPYESTGLKENKKNRKIVEDKYKAVQYALKTGTFDYLRFFPNGSKAKYFRQSLSNVLFSECWEKWLEVKSVRRNTLNGWQSTYKNYLGPHFGHFPIAQIAQHDLLVFRKMLEQKGLKANTINDKVMKVLCIVLLKAHHDGLIAQYPCQGIKRLIEAPVDLDPLSYDELGAFLDKLQTKKKPEWHDLVYIWTRTGLRPGEIYALKWHHIDYFNKKLMVRETRSSGIDGPPKTPSSVRDVDLRPSVVEAFKRQEARTGLQNSYVWMTQANKPCSDAFTRKKFRHLLRLAGLKYRPPKQLRHTFATLHIAAGENISWVSKMLGHSSVEITLKKYNRFIPNLTREDGSAFEHFMGIQ